MEVNKNNERVLNVFSKFQGTYINGWYVRDFLGKTGQVDYEALKSGLNAVPLTISGIYG